MAKFVRSSTETAGALFRLVAIDRRRCVVRVASKARRNTTLPPNRSAAGLALAAVCKKVYIPGSIELNMRRIEDGQAGRPHHCYIHAEVLKHRDKFFPVNARLLQSQRPKF